ncbi:MAG: nodulation protein NfeD [Elusimicrobia bacterium]|nr:nodulation protein NfeD [Elusimicrobiota bacterium]
MSKRTVFALLCLAAPLFVRAGSAVPVLFRIDGVINPVVAEYICDGLKEAEKSGVPAAVIEMDTPGGLMDSMRQIIKGIETAPFPVIVYVGDAGARAASAGAFITFSSDIAVMAEGTNIGAAHPVNLGADKTPDDVGRKMTEDARAYIKAIAEKHGRNRELAERTVTESVSVTAEEALEAGLIEYVVKDFGDMKKVLAGKKVVKNGKETEIDLSGMRQVEMTFFKKFLNYIAHPNISYILILLGIYGLIYEFSNPGIGFGAVIGGASLLLAALSLQLIPINVAGVLFLLFGVILMILDIWVPSFGILTVGGLVSFLFGSLTLFDVKEFPVDVSLSLALGATGTTALFFIFAAGSGLSIQRKKVTTGISGMIGLEGEVKKTLDPEGEVFVRGELWEARTAGGKIKKGQKVEVTEVKGNLLVVKEKENIKE